MKGIFTSVIALFSLFTGLSGQWEIINEGIPYRLTPTVDFINSDTGWIAGNDVILQTKDGGQNWIVYEADITGDYREIDFINDSTGWAINDAGILKTMDGGQSWVVQKDTVEFGELLAVSDSLVYAVLGSKILKTPDGGTTWEEIYTSESESVIYAASFLHNDTGIFAGGKNLDVSYLPKESIILRTVNGGETWNEMTLAPFNNLLSVKLMNDSSAFFMATDNSGKYYICKTTDAFNTWSVLKEHPYPIRSCRFSDDGVIIAVVEDNSVSYIMRSADSGLTWEEGGIRLPLNWNYEICFGSEATGYVLGIYIQDLATGSAHIIMKSTDRGNSWSNMRLTLPLQDVSFIDDNTGIIVSCDAYIHYRFGNIFRTGDAGRTWDNFFSSNTNLPITCQFPHGSLGYLLTYNYDEDGKLGLLQTPDTGRTWIETETLLPYTLPIWGWVRDNGKLFMNEHSGYIAVKNRIYTSGNSGESWELMLDCDICELNSVFFNSDGKGWAVGEMGRIYRHTTQETWDEVTSGTDLPLKNVFFADGNTGWIAGGFKSDDDFRPLLLKSLDGGESWIELENVNYMIHDMLFKDSLHGWVVGEDDNEGGIIMETTDGGESWTMQVDSLSAPLNAIHYKNGYVWVVGMNGYILRLFDSTSISSTERYVNDACNSIVLQNYPNPFRLKTVIGYYLPAGSEVELGVYDLTGRNVSVLVKEHKLAGKYEVEWSAEGIKPGIYFCTMKTIQSRKVVKMILIK